MHSPENDFFYKGTHTTSHRSKDGNLVCATISDALYCLPSAASDLSETILHLVCAAHGFLLLLHYNVLWRSADAVGSHDHAAYRPRLYIGWRRTKQQKHLAVHRSPQFSRIVLTQHRHPSPVPHRPLNWLPICLQNPQRVLLRRRHPMGPKRLPLARAVSLTPTRFASLNNSEAKG